MHKQLACIEAEKLALIGSRRNDLLFDQASTRNVPLLAANLSEALRSLAAQHVSPHAWCAKKRPQPAALDKVPIVAEVLDSAAHGDTAYGVRLGKLRLGGNLAFGRIDPIVDGRLDIFVDALIQRLLFRGHDALLDPYLRAMHDLADTSGSWCHRR